MTLKEIMKAAPDGLVARAYRFAEQAHKGQKRTSGEPYLNHAVATAETLASWNLDETTIAGGILHDVVEDTRTTREELVAAFGEEIAFLVDGVTKLSHIKYRGVNEKVNSADTIPSQKKRGAIETQAKAESLRKMILAVSEDLRVLFIKLADRLHNMRTLSALPPVKQKRIAFETDEIYAPLAYRLGMQHVSGELRDLAFPHIHPEENTWLKQNVKDKYEERLAYLKRVKPAVEKALAEHQVAPLAIDFRAKRYSSLYKKLLRYDMDVDKIHDLVAMRIIVQTVEQCYAALGIIHQLWPPLPGRIKDYIAMPKPNGYRSLHTTVIGPDGKNIEVQIRTKEMHEEDEIGVAAHWVYEQRKAATPPGGEGFFRKSFQKLTRELTWVQQLRRWQEKYRGPEADPEEFMKTMKVDFFRDRIFAVTPKGDVLDLPWGATPVDFAYNIHSEVGNSCVGAKINGTFTPLDHELHSGDVVEILTQKNKKPSEDWLKFVKTAIARDHIRAALRAKTRSVGGRAAPTKAELRIVVKDRVGLIKDLSTAIARSHVNIVSFTAYNPKGGKFPVDKVVVATADRAKLDKLVLKLKQVKDVREVSYQLL
jgi:GTP pyrophosphokinase